MVICTAHASIDTAVEAMRRGAIDYLEKPFTPEQLRTVLARVERTQRLKQRAEGLADQVARTASATDFTTEDPAMKTMVEIVERAAARGPPCSSSGKTAPARASWRATFTPSAPWRTARLWP